MAFETDRLRDTEWGLEQRRLRMPTVFRSLQRNGYALLGLFRTAKTYGQRSHNRIHWSAGRGRSRCHARFHGGDGISLAGSGQPIARTHNPTTTVTLRAANPTAVARAGPDCRRDPPRKTATESPTRTSQVSSAAAPNATPIWPSPSSQYRRSTKPPDQPSPASEKEAAANTPLRVATTHNTIPPTTRIHADYCVDSAHRPTDRRARHQLVFQRTQIRSDAPHPMGFEALRL